MTEWVYEHMEYDNGQEMRYVLGTKGKNPLICIGVNPSTATPEQLDSTMKVVSNVVENSEKYDSYIMLNLYPQRAKNPDEMDKQEKFNDTENKKNLEYIEQVLSQGNLTIWAAWGTLITKRSYLFDNLKQIADIAKKYSCTWISRGDNSKDGHPHHPLYVANNAKMEPFNIKQYVECA